MTLTLEDPPRVALDYVLTLWDLRNPGVDFTERVELLGGSAFYEVQAEADAARLRLVAKAVQLRASTGFRNDPEDARKFAHQVLSVSEATATQSVYGCHLALVATIRRRPDQTL